MTNILTLKLTAKECNGYPKFKIYINEKLFDDFHLNQNYIEISIPLTQEENTCTLKLVRYGKEDKNTILLNNEIIEDQTLEIESIKVDNVTVPNFIIFDYSYFVFNDKKIQTNIFGPNGVWKFNFKTPIITWILTEKMHHEAKYSDAHLLPNSYKIDPNKVDKYFTELENALRKVDLREKTNGV